MKDADFQFFRTDIKSGPSFAEKNKCLGEKYICLLLKLWNNLKLS